MLTFVSESVLIDTILSLGLMICFYYGLTAIGCIWYFRKELFTSFYNFIFKFLFPLLGGLAVVRLLHDAQGQRRPGLRRTGASSSGWVWCSSSASA